MEMSVYKILLFLEVQVIKSKESLSSELEDGEIVDDEEFLEFVKKKMKKDDRVFEELEEW